MRIPHTIPKNVIEAYRCSGETILLPREQGRSIRAENTTWDDSSIPPLRILALTVLVERWKDNPILEELPTCADRDVILEILPIDLPFELIVERIPYEYYWSRAAKYRWQYNNPEDHGNSWRRLYCERHLAEYLEALSPEHHQSALEESESLLKLVRPYVNTLKIRSLISSKFPFKWSANERREEGEEGEGEEEEESLAKVEEPSNVGTSDDSDVVHHIPFNVILPELSEIRQLSLNFGMIYMNDGFEWRDFRFSVEDCLNLGRALNNCPKMEKVSLTRSNLDQPRAAALLEGIVTNTSITEIDLSHCKLGDDGALVVGEFIKSNKCLKELSLENNRIGAIGLSGIVHDILQETGAHLKHLDLRLNPLSDTGGVHICALLLRTSSLERLNISGCGFGAITGNGIADVISSGYTKFSSIDIDLSNNDLGPIAGAALEVAVKGCSNILSIDVRMCNLAKESEWTISQSVARNRDEMRREEQAKFGTYRRSTVFNPGRTKSLMPLTESESFRRAR